MRKRERVSLIALFGIALVIGVAQFGVNQHTTASLPVVIIPFAGIWLMAVVQFAWRKL